MTIVNIEQGSEAWHEIRLGRITGTRFKEMMAGTGTDTYKNLVLDVAAEIITNDKPSSYTNETMQRGIDLEPEARKEYADFYELKVDTPGFVMPDDPKYSDWVGISPDGLIDDQGVKAGLEIKCPLAKTHLKYLTKGVMPNEYKWQVQGGIFVTGYPRWTFVSYYPGLSAFVLEVEPDETMQAAIAERLPLTIKAIKEQLEFYKEYQ